MNWIELSSVLRLRQHNIGYTVLMTSTVVRMMS